MLLKFKIPALHIIKIVCFCTFLTFVGCKKDIESEDVATVFEISKRPLGKAIGNPEVFSFGAAGGSFSSINDDLKIEIPNGAVSSNATLTAQQITNTSPAAFGNAYRIFTNRPLIKPITIKLSYENHQDSLHGDPECTISVSIQDSTTGIWTLQPVRVINSGEKNISFSTSSKVDISCVAPVRLTPAYTEVRPTGEVSYRLLSNIIIPQEGLCAVFGANATPAVLGKDYLVEIARIDKWELLSTGKGVGSLVAKGNTANYKTSQYELPDINPATILVFLKQSVRPLMAKVFVSPEVTGLTIWIGNKQYHFTDDMVDVSVDSNKALGIYWEGTNGQGNLTCQKNKPGTYSWNSTSTQFLFEPADFSPLQAFQQFYNDGTTVSAGDIRIKQSGGVGQKISGSFEIANAGSTNTESGNGEYLGASKVVGIFNLMRDK